MTTNGRGKRGKAESQFSFVEANEGLATRRAACTRALFEHASHLSFRRRMNAKFAGCMSYTGRNASFSKSFM